MVLETIHSRDDLLRLTPEEQRTLCAEIRQFLVEHVSRTAAIWRRISGSWRRRSRSRRYSIRGVTGWSSMWGINPMCIRS